MTIRHSIDNYPPISGQQDGSFARYTIKNRLPHIIHNIIEENNYGGKISLLLEQLESNILYGKVELLPQTGAAISAWHKWLKPYIGWSWLELPFYFAEAYFYRMILEYSDFFSSGLDPFYKAKCKDLSANYHQLSSIFENLLKFNEQEMGKSARLKYLINLSLWGNKSDLSQMDLNLIRSSELRSKSTIQNDAEAVCNHLFANGCRVDIVLDNSGIELFTDLLLAEQLISLGVVKNVVLHAKQLPTFVSDATKADIIYLCDFLKDQPNQHLVDFSDHINNYLLSGAIIIEDDAFWNEPLHFYEMPSALHSKLEKSDLIIFKGDANYRRIFGDKELSRDIQLADLAQYLPSLSAAIRILKSEIIVGFDPKNFAAMHKADQNWLINGKYGIIQMINK